MSFRRKRPRGVHSRASVLRKARPSPRARYVKHTRRDKPRPADAPLRIIEPMPAMAPVPAPPTRAQMRAAAQAHALEALESLATLAKGAHSEAVRVSAANAVLDRAHGKPAPGARLPDEDGAAGGRVVEVRWLDPNWP